jgi:hemerythrin-like domain-containing protein
VVGKNKRAKGLIEEHVHKEEHKIFPAAQRELDQSRGEELGRQIQQMKQNHN